MAVDILPVAHDARRPAWKRIGTMREAGLIAIILSLCVIMSFASPHFLTLGNFRAMLMSFSVEGIVVVGMTILLIVGGIDLSVGSVVCFSMVLSGSLFLLGVDPWTASLVGIAASAAIGCIMGFFVTVVGLNHFITSLAAMVIVRGLCLVITKGTPLSLFTLPPAFKAVGQGTFFGVPYVIVIFIAVVAVFDFLLRRATAFRKVFYTGSNEKAALYSGIKTKDVKFWVTVLCTTLSGVAGTIYMARFGAATPTFGVGMELNIIAAAVIGGASLNGGSGTILGAILGIALLSVVTSSLILLDVSVYWQDMIKGCILLAAVSIDHMLHKRKAA
ncbi:ABC transporter permease [Sinorhizobium medicae]|uniref:Monosaccharide-transporting ATPase n=1 Tax=Sinorhizobium medicae TaxID=110321 RepID=A0A508WZL4_9HYPH|nr:ABC transporter permease [Sinorhizobium medicae]MDX0636061.1 ABC transporter permease [Sinorhizobium medicae]MDX0998951.1 ABC transporter permease [Sinorhizobium medicae]MDX1182896.1 ABC transporter permease [Sinorhizobium medicae]RVI92831.1 ABC transporter permease [Sinorhizobium medicae]WQO63552.1 ABC transporter permease [Sinorhizobium medicae]